MSTKAMIVLLFAPALLSYVAADFDCLCSIDSYQSIYSLPSNKSNIIGKIHRTCKAVANISTADQWIPVFFNHKLCGHFGYRSENFVTSIAYIVKCDVVVFDPCSLFVPPVGYCRLKQNQTIRRCQGSPPEMDFLTTRPPTISPDIQTPSNKTTESKMPTARPSTTSDTSKQWLITHTSILTTSRRPTERSMQSTRTTTQTVGTIPSFLVTSRSPTATPGIQTPSNKSAKSTVPVTVIPTTSNTISQSPTTHSTRWIATRSPTERTLESIMTTAKSVASLGNTTLCSASVVQYAQQDREILTQLGDSCYTIVPHRVSWSHAEAVCNLRGGHLFHVRNAEENLFFYITLDTRFNHSVWMGLHDTINEEHFQWTSGAPLNYTNWVPGRKSNFTSHNVEDCAVFVPYKNHGQWDDIACGADSPFFEHIMGGHYFICQFPIRSSAPATHQVISGDIHHCPSQMRFLAQLQGNHIGQYGTSCYEQVPARGTWYNADQDCRRKGGHLLQIGGPQEEAYIQTFLSHVDSQHAVWIGLHDQGHEETFTWTSGEPLTYTNWLPGRRSNFFSHNVEDCVAFLPYKQGQWDDIPCGGLVVQSGSGLHQRVETHPHICEFHIASFGGPSLIGK